MKRSLGALGLFLSGAFASGCPLYSDNVPYRECFYATDCPLGYRCSSWGECVQSPPHGGPNGDGGVSDAPGDGDAPPDVARDGDADAPSSDASSRAYCGNPQDCDPGETCSIDATCHPGACSTIGCINQFQCASPPIGGTCVRANNTSCGNDRWCPSTERCIDGRCQKWENLCTDRSQCDVGKVCADGHCIAICSTDAQCPSGFLCNTTLGYCGAKAKSCDRTRDCGSASEVCVDGACVPRCMTSGACGDGGNGLCVDNGCVPRVGVLSACVGNGTLCGSGDGVCLRGHCYDRCGSDAGTCGPTEVCRNVTVGSGSYGICTPPDRYGTECEGTTPRMCGTDRTCIDGFCK